METIDEILEALRAIVDAADGRSLTDEEAQRYEQLEARLAAKRRDDQIRARQTAYDTPVHSGVYPAAPKSDDELDQAFNHYLRTGKPNADMSGLKVNGPGPWNALQVGTDSEGGYLVPPGFREKLVDVRKAFGGIAPEAETITTETGNPLEFPSLDDTANEGAITAEEAALASGADLVFGSVTLGAFKYTSAGAGSNLPMRLSVELVQDAFVDIEAVVSRKLGMRIARKQAKDWVRGTGTTLPYGIAHAGLTTDVTLATEATLTYAKLLEIEGALDPAYEQNAKWVFNKATWTHIRGITDEAGRPLVMDQAVSGMGGRPAKTLLGYPVVLDQSFIDITQDGVDGHFLVFGDIREAYLIRRVRDFVLVVDPYTRAINGQIQYHAWERADGNIQNRSAYVLADNITT